MSTSHNYRIDLVPPGHLDANGETQGGQGCSSRDRCPNAKEYVGRWGWPIETDHTYRSGGPITYWATYNYITGRAGRVTQATRHYCKDCAEKHAKRHGLTLPVAPATDIPDSVARGGMVRAFIDSFAGPA